MKKSFLSLLVVGLFFVSCAQSKIGVKAGANIPDLTGEDAVSSIKNKIGFYVGGFFAIPVSEHFTVQPELLWSNKGYKYQELGDYNTTFNYIHIPVLLKYHSKGFYVESGPQIGILITAKQKIESGPNESIKDSFKSTAFSWGAGVGYELPSGFSVGIRYNLGLSSISKESSIDAKFNVLMIGVAKSFDFNGKSR